MGIIYYSFKDSPEHGKGPYRFLLVCSVLVLDQEVCNNIRYLL